MVFKFSCLTGNIKKTTRRNISSSPWLPYPKFTKTLYKANLKIHNCFDKWMLVVPSYNITCSFTSNRNGCNTFSISGSAILSSICWIFLMCLVFNSLTFLAHGTLKYNARLFASLVSSNVPRLLNLRTEEIKPNNLISMSSSQICHGTGSWINEERRG